MTHGAQLALFADAPAETTDSEATRVEDLDGLEKYAFLYTATAAGNNSGVRFMATVEDARKWCSSDLSRGVIHGTPWAYFWTSVPAFLECHWGEAYGDLQHSTTGVLRDGAILDMRQAADSGEWDERIASTGCRKIPFSEMGKLLARFGITTRLKGKTYAPGR
ncbi:Uncharacterised protein [Actinobaculum suis]|uniref:Uncharacterized protein n=1 Tax=Actinobaculum suis TaxID=1657 RepID=A0A7Z8Y8K4_9ACTO|nr:hypothetical protein [Actinobaculum suis]VDG76196.1 Uncharacterised protein [Actinobaculum suis]